jgi:hypothetical protein
MYLTALFLQFLFLLYLTAISLKTQQMLCISFDLGIGKETFSGKEIKDYQRT